MITYILVAITGAILGCGIALIFFKPKIKSAGTLRLYKGEGDERVSLYVELDDNPEKFYECEYVTFEVRPVKL